MKKRALLFKIAFFTAVTCFLLTSVSSLALADPRDPETLSFPNPLGNEEGSDDPNIIIGQVINAVLGVVGSLALLMFVYGGFTWMLAAGNSERIEKGKNIIIWAVLGLVVIFSAYAIVNFVLTGALGLGG